MIKILIASAEVNNNQSLCRLLTNDKKFFIHDAFSVNDVLDTYAIMQPDLLIIGTSLGVSNCINIINRISMLPNLLNNCYTIIVATQTETNNIIEKLHNLSKVYKIIDKPFNINKILATVNEISDILIINELNFEEIRALLLLLNINITSKGAHYLIYAIITCYYLPCLLEDLENDVYNRIAEYYNTTQEKVRINIRNTLLTLDTHYIDKTSFPLLKLLDSKDNTTPKRFIEIVSTYFRHKKRND